MWFVLELQEPPGAQFDVEYDVEQAKTERVPSYAVAWATSENAALVICCNLNAARQPRKTEPINDGFEIPPEEVPM